MGVAAREVIERGLESTSQCLSFVCAIIKEMFKKL